MLPDAERYRLHFGPYQQPKYHFGDVVSCEARGEMKIIRQTDAKIPWPVGLPVGTGKRGRGTLVLYADLKRAIELEAAGAVMHWWDLSHGVVAKWRRLLSVPRDNPGSQKLFEASLSEDADRAQKIGAARRGKKRTSYVSPMLGKKHTEATKKLMSELRRKPWHEWEDQLLIDLVHEDEVMKQTGRGLPSIRKRKKELGVPDGRSSVVRKARRG